MQITAASALAILAFANTAVGAESLMYKMSTRQLFGIGRRQEQGAYEPEEANCREDATTCAEACGDGFEVCASTDNSIHCFDKGHGQVCCPSDVGNSCDPGFYCAAAPDKSVVCCDEKLSLEACAAAQQLPNLARLTAAATTTTASSTTTTTSSSTTTTPTTTTTPLLVSNTTVYLNETSTSCTSTISGSASFAGTNATTTKGSGFATPPPAKPTNATTSKTVAAGASGIAASAMAAIVGVAFAAMML